MLGQDACALSRAAARRRPDMPLPGIQVPAWWQLSLGPDGAGKDGLPERRLAGMAGRFNGGVSG